VATVSQVGFLSTAARVCGVPPSLVCEWVARGLGRDPDRPPTRLFAEFADAIERARGKFEEECLLRITAAAEAKPENWRAAAWQLERFAPERYGGRRFTEAAAMVATEKVKALVAGVLDLVERHVPVGRQESALADVAVLAEQIDAGAARELIADPLP
jgi:hypothetical protein